MVALPFLRTPLSPAAIAVGAMAPDLPLFLRGTPLNYQLTHSFAWIPVTVMVAWMLLVLWRTVLRPAVRELSPAWLATRLPAGWDDGATAGIRESFAVRGSARPSLAGAAMVAVSLTIGVLSHLLWDPFTHVGRWGTQLLPVLAQMWGPLPGYTWLQHGSSMFGLAVLAIFGCRWLRRQTPISLTRVLPAWPRWLWWFSMPAVLIGGLAVGLVFWGALSTSFTFAHLAYRILPPLCAMWGVATTSVAVAIQVARATNIRQHPRNIQE